MEKGQFDYIYRTLLEIETQILELYLSDKDITQQEIAKSVNCDQSNVGRKLKAIAKKFNYSESSLDYQEYLVKIFSQYKPDLVDKKIIEHYNFYPVFMPDKPEEPDSPFYIERYQIRRCSVESQCYQEIERPGSLVRIKAPNKMGKTSLIKKIQDKANENNYISQYLKFNLLIEDSNVSSVNSFIKGFNKNLKSRFPDVPDGPDWDDNNAKISCTKDLKALLLNLQKNLVLILDEVDEIFQYPEISKDFFAMLRHWYEESNNVKIWRNLRMVIAYSTEYHGTLDIYQSPFNVGLPIELKEFEKQEVIRLILLHQLDPKIVTDLMSMVGGHPYLIRLALYKISQEELTIERFLKEAPTDSGIYRYHLSRHLETMGKRSKIKTVFQEILKANSPVSFPDQNREIRQLEAMGLITIQGNKAETRCELYRQYFGEFLG
ncbi:MAG: hypothetical protein F6K39_04355 [Okeania sp. SIO3B3]|nr:hypothetical protein [Okeania sp. SIO3B3]